MAREQPRSHEADRFNFLENFIARHYQGQPPSVRVATFIAFVCLFVYGFLRLVGSDAVIGGTAFEPEQHGRRRPARNYDIRVGQKLVGTNSKGEFHVLLSSPEYFKLLVSRQLHLSVADKEGTLLGEYPVPIQLVPFMLQDLRLKPDEPIVSTNVASPSLISQIFAPVLHAAVPPRKRDLRLFVKELMVQADLRSVRLTCRCAAGEQALFSTRVAGREAGPVPVIKGERVLYDYDYFFDVPSNQLPNPQWAISLVQEDKYFLPYEEKFSFSKPMAVGREVLLSGDRGGRLTALLLSPYDVVLYDKRDLEAASPALMQDLVLKGFTVSRKPSPLGDGSQTNAVFAGAAVPYQAMQMLLETLSARGVALKTIGFQRHLKSDNPYEIQIGGLKALDGVEPLPADTLKKLITAPNESAFRSALPNSPEQAK